MNKKLRGNLMLLLTAMIWGSAFVAQRAGMDLIGPYTFNCLRSVLGGLFLIPIIFLLSRRSGNVTPEDTENKSPEEKKKEQRLLLTGGICCGIILFAGSTLQQIGLVYTTAGKAGFITALYIILVPILSLFIGKKIRPIIWLCVLLSAVGLYLLCMKDGLSLSKGDFLVLLCAVAFATHILVVDYFSPKTDGVKMSCIQFFVCALLSIPPILAFETVDWHAIADCWLPICYAGILSSGVGYTFQIVAQKDTEPTIASMLMSLESVFAVLAGIVILHEMISVRELLGCIIMFTAIIIAQLPSKEARLAAKS